MSVLQDQVESEEVLQGQSSESNIFVGQLPDGHALPETDVVETPHS